MEEGGGGSGDTTGGGSDGDGSGGVGGVNDRQPRITISAPLLTFCSTSQLDVSAHLVGAGRESAQAREAVGKWGSGTEVVEVVRSHLHDAASHPPRRRRSDTMVSPCRGHGSLLHRPRHGLWTEPHCRSTDGPSRSARDCRKSWRRTAVVAAGEPARRGTPDTLHRF